MGTLLGSNITLCRQKAIGNFKERVRIMGTTNNLANTFFLCKHMIFDTYKFFPQRGVLVVNRFKFFSTSSNGGGNDDGEDENLSKDSNFATEELEKQSKEKKSSASSSSGVSDCSLFLY